MANHVRITVHLPNLCPTVTLPNRLGTLLQLIIDASSRGINTLQLQEAGVIDPAAGVTALKKCGARIQTSREAARDAKGNMRNAIAHYAYRGWDGDLLAYSIDQETLV